MNLRDWIRIGKEKGASDLLMEADTAPVFRIRGELVPVGEPVAAGAILEAVRETLGQALWDEFTVQRSADLSKTLSGVRCRIHVFQTLRGLGLCIRLLSSFRASIHDCNLHPELKRLVNQRTGLLIVSGPTGSGKSTTLAAMIEEINVTQRRHVVTLESPIEYLFKNRQSFIRQREIPSQSPSFEQALIDAMRENPDVIAIGEMRTPEVMRLTLNAAETGHLVIATMHSATSAEALARICMSFAPEMQGAIRAQLSDCLVGVVCQRLVYLPQIGMRVPVCELLVANSNARATIRSGQFSQILSAIQAGGADGMLSFERYQKWIDEKKDWVRPAQAPALEESEPFAAAPLPVARTAPSPRSVPGPTPRPVSGSAPRTAAPARASSPNAGAKGSEGGGRLEIDPVDEDLEALAQKISDSPDSDGES